MTFDEIEELVRRYLSTGVTVVVILIAPVTGAGDRTRPGNAEPGGNEVIAIEPGKSAGDGVRCDAPEARWTSADHLGNSEPQPTARPSTNPQPTTRPSTNPQPTTRPSTNPQPSGTSGTSGPSTSGGSDARGSGDGATGRDRTCPTPLPDDPKDGGSAPDDHTGAGGTDPERDTMNGGDTGRPTDSGSDGTGSAGDGSGNAPRRDDRGRPQTDQANSTTDGTTAAAKYGWGTPNREDDFSGGADQWTVYNGTGHAGKGTRSPSAVSLGNGILTITGDASGATAGMAWNPGQKYGRWEGRVRAPASDPSYNALLLLWPDAENFPAGGEIDFMEMTDSSRQTTNMFLHHGAENSQVHGQVEVDATEWHNWAVEWTPTAITAYVDGQEWFRNTDTSTFPPGPMHLCIQLDWFPKGGAPDESAMHVDWVRQYSLDGGGDTGGGTATAGGGTGSRADTGASRGGVPPRLGG